MSDSGARQYDDPFSRFLGPETDKKITCSGARNSENGSEIFLEPETDIMVQFLAPDIVIMGEKNFMQFSMVIVLMTVCKRGLAVRKLWISLAK